MNKKLIAAALASAFIAPAVLADVQIYGVMNADVESVKATGATTAAADKKSTTRVSSNTSRIGFKGSEDLGNGLKAIWQVENGVWIDGSTPSATANTFANRNSFVGLNIDNAGQVLLGQYDSAYKVLVVPVNPLGDGIADVNVTTFSRANNRLKNSVHYYSPSWAGFKVGASYGFGETHGTTPSSEWALAASYDIAGFNVAAGYTRKNDGLLGASNNIGTAYDVNDPLHASDAWKAVVKYTIADTQIGAGFERIKVTYNDLASSSISQNSWTIGAVQKFGAFGIGLAYVKINDFSGEDADNTGANQWTLSGTYDLSKRTQAYAFYTRISNDENAKINFANNPIAGGVGAGSNPTGFGLGVKHTF
ncbi:porin [Laribacter hongkongensis]|uniref:porin n=1 Tax=Laribacter hongkongensis TaxID=168471 RepID=UPI001EFDEFFC|nr:porin [Laribacter hongkongensis]MCG9031358.1 porin [Laribacter hongkongensis]MCG9091059.1 porin [Laribacter hongkongensis]